MRIPFRREGCAIVLCLACFALASVVGAQEDCTPEQTSGWSEFSDAPGYVEASHGFQYVEWLGEGRDTEPTANTPDLDLYDDGVSWDPTLVQPGNTFDLTVTVTISPARSRQQEDLGVWIDWDQDTQFEDDEQVVAVTGRWADPGSNVWVFPVLVPLDAKMGATWLRARNDRTSLTAGTLGPYGFRRYGEVEDHEITVTPELSTVSLLLLGAAGIRMCHRRRR